MRNAEGLGLELQTHVDDGSVIVHYDSPQELELDVHCHTLTRLIDEHKVERIVIDSLAAYKNNEVDRREFHDFIYALTTHFIDRLVTAFLNYESPELLGVSQISEERRSSTIVDNIILLNYVGFSNRLRRAITVPKARGSAPARSRREYTIQRGGIVLQSIKDIETEGVEPVPQLPFSSYYGVLARSPARSSPVIEERVAAGKELSETESASDGEKLNGGPAARSKTDKLKNTKETNGRRGASKKGKSSSKRR